MSYIDTYKARLGVQGGNANESNIKSTINTLNNTFENSPSYKTIKINGINTGARIQNELIDNKKKMLLKPNSKVNKGDIVEYDNAKWIITEFFNDIIFPSAIMTFCNNSLRWKVGTNILEIPCILQQLAKTSNGVTETVYMMLGDGKLMATVKNDDSSSKIKKGQVFIFNNKISYKVTSIYEFIDSGIIYLYLDEYQASKSELENGISKNANTVEPVSNDTTITNPTKKPLV